MFFIGRNYVNYTTEEVYSKLQEFYKPHNERFFNLLGRQFDWGK